MKYLIAVLALVTIASSLSCFPREESPPESPDPQDAHTDLSTVKSIVLSRKMDLDSLLGTGELQPDAELWTISQLHNRDFNIRWRACCILGNTSSLAAATALCFVARTDRDYEVHASSTDSLARMGPLGRRFLVHLLRTGDRRPFTLVAYAKSCRADLESLGGYHTGSGPAWWEEEGHVIFENESFEEPLFRSGTRTGTMRLEDSELFKGFTVPNED